MNSLKDEGLILPIGAKEPVPPCDLNDIKSQQDIHVRAALEWDMDPDPHPETEHAASPGNELFTELPQRFEDGARDRCQISGPTM